VGYDQWIRWFKESKTNLSDYRDFPKKNTSIIAAHRRDNRSTLEEGKASVERRATGKPVAPYLSG
jgi:hypothetical protein